MADKSNKKMRIMHISSLESHPCFTDLIELQGERQDIKFVTLELSENLEKGREHEKEYEIDETSNPVHITIKKVKKIIDHSYDIKLRGAFNTLLKKHKPDIIHIHVFSGISLLPILNAASSLGIRKVLTLNDHSLFCIKGSCLEDETKCKVDSLDVCGCKPCKIFAQKNKVSIDDYNKLRIERAEDIINQCDKIICPSKHQKKVLTGLFSENPDIVPLYYGLNLPPAPNKKKKSSKVVFGYLGMMWSAKGIHLIEYVLDMLKEHDFKVLMGLTYNLNIESDKSTWKRLRSYDKVALKKNISREGLYDEFFSRIDYLIIPSIWNETGPMTLFEAFYYEVPVIIFDNESMKEKIDGNKSSLVFKDKEELAKIMEDIINGKIVKKENDNFDVKRIEIYAKEIDYIYKDVATRKPRDLSLKLGYRCNQNCIFCAFGDVKKRILPSEFDPDIKFENIKTMLRKLKKDYDVLELTTSSEPTIRKDFFPIVKLAHRLGYKLELVTNGRMFSYKRFCDKLKDYNLKLTINVHGHNAEIHEATTRVDGSFKQVIKGIQNLREYDSFDILIQILLTKLNYKIVLPIVKFIAQLGITKIRLTCVEPSGNAELNFHKVVPTYSEILPFANQALSWLKTKENIQVHLKSFPACIKINKFAEVVQEPLTTAVVDYTSDKTNFYLTGIERPKTMKQKFDFCPECRCNVSCEGIWNIYVEKYGKEEFKPIR